MFGAGASYGSGGTNKVAPLGNELFRSLCTEYPKTWGSKIKGALKEKFLNKGFEIGMDSLYKTPDNLEAEVAPLLVELSVFFSKFKIISQENLYFKLVQKFDPEFRNKSIVISTLNYDCLIEYAFLYSKMSFSYLEDNLEAKLLKLHGSCNFIPQGINFNPQGLTLKIGQATFNTGFKPVLPEEVEGELANVSIPSAMSLYTHEKRNIVSPNSIKLIIQEYQNIAQAVKTIIIVGVRPNPIIDSHVWEILESAQAKIFLIGNRRDSSDWISDKSENREFIDGYFLDNFGKICSLVEKNLS